MTLEKLEAIEARYDAVLEYMGDNYGKSVLVYSSQEDVEDLIAEVKRLKRERDAAVADMSKLALTGNECDMCKHNRHNPDESCLKCCRATSLSHVFYWKWRGMQEADNAGN